MPSTLRNSLRIFDWLSKNYECQLTQFLEVEILGDT